MEYRCSKWKWNLYIVITVLWCEQILNTVVILRMWFFLTMIALKLFVFTMLNFVIFFFNVFEKETLKVTAVTFACIKFITVDMHLTSYHVNSKDCFFFFCNLCFMIQHCLLSLVHCNLDVYNWNVLQSKSMIANVKLRQLERNLILDLYVAPGEIVPFCLQNVDWKRWKCNWMAKLCQS